MNKNNKKKQEIIDEAVKALESMCNENDIEKAHIGMDEILLKTLRKLGAGAVADAYKNYPHSLYYS